MPHGYNEGAHAGMEPGKASVGLPGAPGEARGAAGRVHCRNHGQVQSLLPHVPAGNPSATQSRYDGRGLRASRARSRRLRGAYDADRPGRALHGPAYLRAHRVVPPPQHLDPALDQRHVSGRALRRPDSGFAAGTDHLELRWRQEGDLRVLPQGREVREGAR